MTQWSCKASTQLLAGLMLVLALAAVRNAVAAPAKWTIFVYMLADNNLEPFALMDLEEIMAAMATEKAGDCRTTVCGADCPSGLVETYAVPCPGGGGSQRRCCSPGNYPDVLVFVDNGQGSALQKRAFDLPHADYSLLESYWTNARTVRALPGGRWEQITAQDEVDMAKPETIANFLRDALSRYPPNDNRKYMLVFWDHGNGWLGYGADGRCSPTGSYTDHVYCNVASLAAVTQGLQAGLINPSTGQRLKLDVIGYDACLMSMYEVGSVMAPYANYLFASELLEPGTGWDYSMLGALVRGVTATGAAVNSVTGHTEKDLAELLIEGYMDSRATGLTMALVDLRVVDSSLDSTMNALASTLTQQLVTTPALGMQLLQQRTLLGWIEGAEDNVDLGALLTRLSAVSKDDLKTKLTAALAAYQSSVVAFQRDNILPDGTGIAIYFPPARLGMDRAYPGFVSTDPAAMSGWYNFLDGLYTAIGTVGTNTGLTFQEAYAVPYWAVTSNTWITHGTLTTLGALTADLMYGFLSPTRTEYIVAGTTVGRIAQYAAVGAWSGQLFGLVQDLTPNDGAVDGLALAYADEQRLTDADGKVTQLIVQMQVYYAKSCYAPVSQMTTGMLKYVFTVATNQSTLQLFTSSGATKAWGEVSPASGGVIIPYLGTIDLRGILPGQGVSFGYSDCLKWGYQGSLTVVYFNVTQAVGILGLDLTRDLATMLTVRGLNGRVKSLYGAFEAAQKTQAGCQCSQLWSYQDAAGTVVTVKGQCVNPFGHSRAWCQYEPESCTGTPSSVDGRELTDFCAPVTTLSGCKCHPNWRFNGVDYYGSCANTKDPQGTWCVVNRTTCGDHRAHPFGPANTTGATVNGVQGQLTGLDFDYCQVVTTNKCGCSNTWDYGGVRYGGTCRTGLFGASSIPGISSDTNWCFVDKSCTGSKHLDGFAYDLCTPQGGRFTEDGRACRFPTTYNDVPLYNCISYNHSTPGTPTLKPWCFTNTSSGAWGYCAPWTCTAALKSNCPAGSPADNPVGWATPVCLDTLCNARKDLANITLCTQDSQADKELLAGAYSSLASSTSFGQLLQSSYSSDSLDAYCSKNFGHLCMDKILDPACPGLFRQNNTWMAATSTAQLCDMGCVRALCQLQEQAKTSVTGTPGVSGNVPSITCADSELTTSVMWSLMRLMDTSCGWPGPATLTCNKLLSPPQLCAADTQISAASGNITDGAALGGNYSASTECAWTINMPEQPYITLNFSRFNTELLYDLVTVEDFDGLVGRFSGNSLPSSISTDTGLLRLKFSTDGSLQGQGFAVGYLASSTPQVNIPTCVGSSKLLQVVLRTRAYGSELSWVVSHRSLLNALVAPTPTEQNIVMAGGALPPSVRSKVPTAIAATAEPEYKDYRSYYSYACLPTGSYSLFTYDSYGDGWEGGRITLTQVVNATTGCVLLSGASPTRFNLTTTFSVTADADTSSAACSALISPDGDYYYAEAGLVIMAEDTKTFTLAKQRKLKEALASLLDVDVAEVTIQSLSNATAQELTDGQKSLPAATSRGIGGRDSSKSTAETVAAVGLQGKEASLTSVPLDSSPASRKLQGSTEGSNPATEHTTGAVAGEGALGAGGGSTIHEMLQQQQWQLPGSAAAGSGSRLRELSKLAIDVPQMVASGLLEASQQQLLQAEQWLLQQQATASSLPPLTLPVQADPADATGAAPTAVQEAEAEAAAALDVAAAAAAAGESLGSDALSPLLTEAAVVAAASDAEAQAWSAEPQLLAESRKLQQLLTLSEDTTWQDSSIEAVPGQLQDDTHNTTTSIGDPDTSADSSSSSSSSSSSGSSAGFVLVEAPTLLSEQPLGPSAGAAPNSGPVHSQLMQQLQAAHRPLKPALSGKNSKAPTVIKTTGGSSSSSSSSLGPAGAPVARVVVSRAVTSLGDVFSRQPAAAAAAAGAGAGAAHPARAGTADIAAVPKPDLFTAAEADVAPAVQPSPEVANQTLGSADELSFVPQSLPFIPGGGDNTAAGAAPDGQSLALFDAITPGRTLLQGAAEPQDSLSSGGSSSDSSSSRGGDGSYGTDSSLLLSGQQPGLLVGPAQIDPEVLGDIIAAGRPRLTGSSRPRPSPGVLRPPDAHRRLSSTDSSSTDSTQHLSWPAAAAAAAERVAEAGSAGSSSSARQLLQTSPARGVTVVVRVNGYEDPSTATTAAQSLGTMVTDGRLQSRLASQGWPGVSVGLLYTTTGSVGSFWTRPDMLRYIIGACVGGGALLAVVIAAWYIRRKRRAGAAQVPPGGVGGGGMRPGPHGRLSCPPLQGPPYLSPQQAAAVVVPYPAASPYGRAASPSAPLLLTPSQQAGFAMSAAASQGSMGAYGSPHRGGRSSMGPYPAVAPPRGAYRVPVSGGSFTGPLPSQQQQQQQAAMGYYPVYPAPMVPNQGQSPPSPPAPAGTAAAPGRMSPYAFAAQPQGVVAGYPVIAPPTAAGTWQQQQGQQQWQQLQ